MGSRLRDPYNPHAFNWPGFRPALARTWIQRIPDNFHSQKPLGQAAQVAVGSEAVPISRGSLGKSYCYMTIKSFGCLKGIPRMAGIS